MMMKSFLLLLIVLAFAGCQNRPVPAPETPGAINVEGNTQALPDRVLNGPLPGCGDDVELVGQSLTLPGQALTFDAGGVIYRVGIVVTGATSSYSVQIGRASCRERL